MEIKRSSPEEANKGIASPLTYRSHGGMESRPLVDKQKVDAEPRRPKGVK
jgi:hypothetical protein